jgi:dihydrofolate reductase
MTVSVFVGMSVDGFIARLDGTFDFLSTAGGEEPHGFEEFFATIDTIVMGRNTFEVVAAFPSWPFDRKRVVILSARGVDHARVKAERLEQMSGEPAEIVAKLAASGSRHLYVDGGITVQRFLDAGMVDRLTITRVPMLIGAGIPLFSAVPRDISLRHIATHTYRTGLVKSEYEVVK